MENLFNVGRIFYGIAIAGLGSLTIYYKEFPYMLIPPNHGWIPGLLTVINISGALLVLAGTCIVFEIRTRPVALLLGTALLLLFCFYFIPYEFISTTSYMRLGEWDNAEKELALSAGALVIAGHYPGGKEISFISFLARLIQFGEIIFSITIISFGIDHFLYAKDVAEYIPAWIPNRIFWAYLAGAGLLGSGIAILLKIRIRLFAGLLGTMILIWFIILHVPKAMAAPASDSGGEVTSAFLALAYSGIAFAIVGVNQLAKTDHRQ